MEHDDSHLIYSHYKPHVGSASAECIHDIDALVSLDRAQCFALEKNTQK